MESSEPIPTQAPTPATKHLALMRALADAQEALSTRLLAHRCGLSRTQTQQLGEWLLCNGYVERKTRRVRFYEGPCRSSPRIKIAYWSLTEKGREHLSSC